MFILSWQRIPHDDIIKWKYFSHYCMWGFTSHRWPVTKGQQHGAFIFSLICTLNKLRSKQLLGWWFEIPSNSLWHCNDLVLWNSPNSIKLEDTGQIKNNCNSLHVYSAILKSLPANADIIKQLLCRLKCMRSLTMTSLTHWGRVIHICVGKLTIIGSDNGLLPERHQAIIWTNAGILLIGPLGTNFSEILIEIQTFSLKKIRLKMSSAKFCSFRLGLNVKAKLKCSKVTFW